MDTWSYKLWSIFLKLKLQVIIILLILLHDIYPRLK